MSFPSFDSLSSRHMLCSHQLFLPVDFFLANSSKGTLRWHEPFFFGHTWCVTHLILHFDNNFGVPLFWQFHFDDNFGVRLGHQVLPMMMSECGRTLIRSPFFLLSTDANINLGRHGADPRIFSTTRWSWSPDNLIWNLFGQCWSHKVPHAFAFFPIDAYLKPRWRLMNFFLKRMYCIAR